MEKLINTTSFCKFKDPCKVFVDLPQCDCKYHFLGGQIGKMKSRYFFFFNMTYNSLICILNGTLLFGSPYNKRVVCSVEAETLLCSINKEPPK